MAQVPQRAKNQTKTGEASQAEKGKTQPEAE